MRMNVVDRLVASVDPERAVRRLKARTQIAAFQGLSQTLGPEANAGSYASTNGSDPFMRRWSVAARDSASDTLPQLGTQRAQARDLTRNNAIAAGAINTNVVRAIGTGLAYSAQPHLLTLGWSKEQAAQWRAHVQAEFSVFADSRECSWNGEQNFYEMQDLVLRSMLDSGDVFPLLPDGKRTVTMPYALRVQLLEADRVGNPFGRRDDPALGISGGVRRALNNPQDVEYHVYKRHPGATQLRGNKWEGDWIKAIGTSGRRRMLHVFKTLRPDQPRGVPYLAPVMGLFKLIGTYTDAEVKAAVVSAFLTVFIETASGAGLPPVFGMGDAAAGQPAVAGQPVPDGPSASEIALGPGAVIGLAKGEKATAVTPGRPNPAFGDFVQAVIDQLGAGLFIGPEMLMKKYSTSYVAARAAFLDAWKHLLDMRTLVARAFCQPVLETWMAESVAIGRIQAPGFFQDARMRWAYTRAGWQGDSQGSINPKDEVAAYLAAIEGRLMTHERAAWELFGNDWQADYPTQQGEHEMLKRDGMLPAPKAGAAAPEPQPKETA